MQIIHRLSGILIASFLFINSYSQPCYGMNQSTLCGIPSPDINKYIISSYSKSDLVETRVPHKYSMVLAPGREYILGVCCDSRFGPVKFSLMDSKNDTVFYDNSDDDYIESIGFNVSDNPLNLIIEITLQASDFKPKHLEDTRACLGLRILYRDVTKKKVP
jgi:hypothetical protein